LTSLDTEPLLQAFLRLGACLTAGTLDEADDLHGPVDWKIYGLDVQVFK
jgi:hypothetical protein